MSSAENSVDPSVVSVVEKADETPPRKKAGRPPGMPNRATVTMRFMIEQVLTNQMHNADRACSDILNGRPPVIDAVTGAVLVKGVAPNPVGWVAAIASLADFTLPRLTRIEVKDERLPIDVEISAEATPEEAQRAYLLLAGS